MLKLFFVGLLDDFSAVIRLVNSYRRIGELSKAAEYLQQMKETTKGITMSSGFNFAHGLYYW